MNYPPPHMHPANGARPGGALPPSPPHSLTKSSNGSGPYSTSSGGGDVRTPAAPMLEEHLLEHYRALRHYVTVSAQQDGEDQRPHHRARDKLLRLSIVQFQELSTDVYDELLRRDSEARIPGAATDPNFPRFLQPKSNFHPKRNQARQKLATLATNKFRELSTDVLFELERRHPQFASAGYERMRSPPGTNPRSRARSGSRARSASRSSPGSNAGLPPHIQGLRRPSNPTSPVGPYSPVSPTHYEGGSRSGSGSGPTNEYGRPLPRGFNNGSAPHQADDRENEQHFVGRASSEYGFDRGGRSSQRATNRSLPYSDHPPSPDAQIQISRLEQKVADLVNQLRQKDEQLEHSLGQEREQAQALKAEINKASNLTSDLEARLRSAETLNGTLQIELQSLKTNHSRLQEERIAGSSDDWKHRYENLELEFQEQRQITEEVRQEAIQNLEEMKVLAERSSQATDQEEHLTRQVAQLELTVQDWKTRFTKAKAQLRNLRAMSTPFHPGLPGSRLLVQDEAMTDPAGLVKDISLTQYQIAVEELMQISRGGDPSAVLDYMRTIVSAVRAVTEDIDAHSVVMPDEVLRRRLKLKGRVSAAANGLVTAAKNYSAGGGLSPVSLVDAAAGGLTAAVVEWVKDVKVRPTPVGELELDGEGHGQGHGDIGPDFARRDAGLDGVDVRAGDPDWF